MYTIYPQEGYKCVCEQLTKGFRNYWYESSEEAYAMALHLDGQGKTVYVAQASFLEKGTDYKGRAASGAAFVGSFFMDVDCGDKKPFPLKADGLKAIAKFCNSTSLPTPRITSSGNGLYCHWILQTALPAGLWKSVATLLQAVVKYYEPGLDGDGLIVDLARVLRPVGATHRKDPLNPKVVKIVADSEPLNTGNLCRLIKAAYEKTGAKLAVPRRINAVTNAEFLAGMDSYPDSSAELIASKCAQVAHFKAVKGDVVENYWYSMVGLLRFTVESPEIIHDWSSGHGDYSREATDSKILQHERSGVGPTTCARLSDCNPALCAGCSHTELTSPIRLGAVMPRAITEIKETGETLPAAPNGWAITEAGVWCNRDDGPVRVYDQPLYVSSINVDHFGESFTIKHRMAHEGWQEFVVPSNKVTEPKAFFSAFIDAHVQVVGKENKGLFMAYVETFMSQLRSSKRVSKLSGQMGWYRDGEHLAFIHGDSIYRKDGSTERVGYSATAPEFVKCLRPTGDQRQWVENTKLLNEDGLEGLAFEFLCTAFGSPLVRFSGYEGAMLSVVGGSGLGKTLTGKWGLSAWGDPGQLLINQDDTQNVTVGRFGVYNTLPAYIDEISNITPENLSHLAYRITQGRDKIRMDKNAKEKSNVNTWNLLGTVSSNHSLLDKLLVMKADPGAEFNRIFEFEIGDDNGYTKDEGKTIFDGISAGHGQVGRDYALWLVQNQEKHIKALNAYTEMLGKKCNARPDERFWVMVGAVALYGGTIAKSLGLSHVNVDRLIGWIIKQINSMRKYKAAEGFDAVSFIGTIIDINSASTLVLGSYDNTVRTPITQTGYREPKGRLTTRIELDKMRLWISADTVKHILLKNHLSVRKFAAILTGKGLVSTSEKINLGRGTVWGGIAQRVWTFDLEHEGLHHTILEAIDKREIAA